MIITIRALSQRKKKAKKTQYARGPGPEDVERVSVIAGMPGRDGVDREMSEDIQIEK